MTERQHSLDVEEAIAFTKGRYKVEQLNSIRPRHLGWKRHFAKRDYIDFFGNKINAGEHFFRCDFGSDRPDYAKLTPDSMERLLFLAFATNRLLLDFANAVAKDRAEEDAAALARYHAMSAALREQAEGGA